MNSQFGYFDANGNFIGRVPGASIHYEGSPTENLGYVKEWAVSGILEEQGKIPILSSGSGLSGYSILITGRLSPSGAATVRTFLAIRDQNEGEPQVTVTGGLSDGADAKFGLAWNDVKLELHNGSNKNKLFWTAHITQAYNKTY